MSNIINNGMKLRHLLNEMENELKSITKEQISQEVEYIKKDQLEKIVKFMCKIDTAYLVKSLSIVKYEDSSNYLSEIKELQKLRIIKEELSFAYENLCSAIDKQYLNVKE